MGRNTPVLGMRLPADIVYPAMTEFEGQSSGFKANMTVDVKHREKKRAAVSCASIQRRDGRAIGRIVNVLKGPKAW